MGRGPRELTPLAPKTTAKCHRVSRKISEHVHQMEDRMKPRQMMEEGSSTIGRAAGVEVTMTFGSVSVTVIRPPTSVIQRNIEDGQAALMRARDALIKPGVKITRAKGKPLYFGSPDRPDVIIREVDGVRTVGKFVGGRFWALKNAPLPPTRKKPVRIGTSG